ncbi:ketosamine-3-kinase isoform X2 [Syngnathus acus]|uniref:ketosamine-3-kinase isoform X2 n=1 Tax=Syngnathus acus TaxID=161584 RepID=UPI0018860B30|nr:ketosamine-3-kinase isoform X2 [Syngnathus acus]
MEDKLKKELGTATLKLAGHAEGGCISQGQSYHTDTGKVFVKTNHKSQAKLMFDGEMASLEAIIKTGTIQVPKPVKVIELATEGCMFVMEYLDIRALSKYSRQLGEQVADLHLHNKRQLEKVSKEQHTVGKGAGQREGTYVDKFGFPTITCCGYIAQRLECQLNMLEKSNGDREVRELWAALQLKIPGLFRDAQVFPALLHGDLWEGNVAETGKGPVIFDPSSFYGHSEYELGIAGMFGGFDSSFFSAYHEKIPKAPGFAHRNQLYQLFNYLNHWNHFGGGYRGSSIRVMKDLLK